MIKSPFPTALITACNSTHTQLQLGPHVVHQQHRNVDSIPSVDKGICQQFCQPFGLLEIQMLLGRDPHIHWYKRWFKSILAFASCLHKKDVGMDYFGDWLHFLQGLTTEVTAHSVQVSSDQPSLPLWHQNVFKDVLVVGTQVGLEKKLHNYTIQQEPANTTDYNILHYIYAQCQIAPTMTQHSNDKLTNKRHLTTVVQSQPGLQYSSPKYI